MRYLTYRSYKTTMRWDEDDKIYYGKVEDIDDLVSFHSEHVETFEKEFHKAVDDYFIFCEEVGKTPNIPK